MLAGSKRVLGDGHPSTLKAANDLADTYTDQGRLPAAAELRDASLAAFTYAKRSIEIFEARRQVAAAAKKAKEASAATWICSVCKHDNDMARTTCRLCMAARGKGCGAPPAQ